MDDLLMALLIFWSIKGRNLQKVAILKFGNIIWHFYRKQLVLAFLGLISNTLVWKDKVTLRTSHNMTWLSRLILNKNSEMWIVKCLKKLHLCIIPLVWVFFMQRPTIPKQFKIQKKLLEVNTKRRMWLQ